MTENSLSCDIVISIEFCVIFASNLAEKNPTQLIQTFTKTDEPTNGSCSEIDWRLADL